MLGGTISLIGGKGIALIGMMVTGNALAMGVSMVVCMGLFSLFMGGLRYGAYVIGIITLLAYDNYTIGWVWCKGVYIKKSPFTRE
jgi:hypothetical protein